MAPSLLLNLYDLFRIESLSLLHFKGKQQSTGSGQEEWLHQQQELRHLLHILAYYLPVIYPIEI